MRFVDTPWDEPTERSEEFCVYCTTQDRNYSPWNRIPAETLDLLLHILNIFEEKRVTIPMIKQHAWYLR